MEFFTNRYDLLDIRNEQGEEINIDKGTCFVINGIRSGMFDLKSTSLMVNISSIVVDPLMLEFGFKRHSEED